MLSIEQLTILSYITDGAVLCRACGEAEGLPISDAVCAYSTHTYAGNDGLYCDQCGKEIVEPYEWTCPSCEAEYSGDEAMTAESEYYENHICNEDCPGDEG